MGAIYRTILTTVILSDSPLNVCDLSVFAERMDSGDLLGMTEQGESVLLEGDEAMKAMGDVGNDGSFFGLEGNGGLDVLWGGGGWELPEGWTEEDQAKAMSEGWRLVFSEDEHPAIERLDDLEVFPSDDAAEEFVWNSPAEHCLRAIKIVTGL